MFIKYVHFNEINIDTDS